MSQRVRTYSPPSLDAAQVLGAQIARARRERRWTARELAERVGISARTVSELEHGSPKVALGIAFEAATLLGVELFGADAAGLARLAQQSRETAALLPARVRHAREAPVRDDF